MTVRVEGVLRTPINTPAANIPIKIITTIGAGETLSSAEVTYVTDALGNYGFDLVYATHEIYAMFDDAFELIGTSVANESVPTPTNINDLLHFSTPIQPEIVDKIYDDIYGCIDDLENDINTCMTCMSDQVVQGDTGVCQAMTVYTNDCLQACSAELTTAIQAGDAQTLSQSQAYTDAAGVEIACCTEMLSTSMAQLCTTMVASTEANGSSIATLRTDMEAGDASIIQSSKAYTDACTGNVEASITNMVRACDAAAYTCMGAISCCITVVEASASKTWYQDEQPVGANIGDLWYDTDNDNAPFYLNSSCAWESVRDASIAAAEAEANAAKAAADLACICSCAYADGIVSEEEARAIEDAQEKADAAYVCAVMYTDAAASGLSSDILVAQNTADQAVINAANAQATADGAVDTYYQDSQPVTGKEGDIWVDTNDGNKQYMYANGAWRSVRDTGIACAQTCAATAENNAQQALIDSATAQSTADGKVRTFYQDAEPTSEMSEGDIWVDTNDGNNQYMYTSGGWVDIQDQAIYTEAATAEANACNFAKHCSDSVSDMINDISAVETYRQDTEPENPNNGDIWYNTAEGNKAYRYDTKGIAGAELYQVNVKKGYGYGYQSTLNNAIPTPMVVRGSEVELFSSSEPDNKTFLWFTDMALIDDTSDMGVNVDGVDYVLTWNSGLKAFESEVGEHAFTADELDTSIPVYLDGAYGVWEPVQDEILVSCTNGLTGDIQLMQCDIIDVNEAVCLQQSGYGIVTCAGDAVASIELLATSYSNTDVACAEILMRADKIAMHNGDATTTTYPFYVEGDNVYMNCAMVNCLESVEITSGILCSGEINAAIIQSAGFNSCSNPAGGAPQGYCLGAGGDAELNNVIIRGVIDGSVICGTTICGGVIKGSAIQSSYIATDVPSLTLTWANQEQYGSMDLTVICNQGNTPYMGYQAGVAASCTATTPNLKIAAYDYTNKAHYTRYTRRYITPYANGTSQLLHCSSIGCCYNVCCNDYPATPAYNDGGVNVCLCFRGTGTDRRIDSGTIRNGQSVTKVSGNTCVTFSATAYCCIYTSRHCQGGYPPRYNTSKWVETGYHVYADVKKHDYCANVTCFCTSLYTNTSARSHRLCDSANNGTMPTSGGPS